MGTNVKPITVPGLEGWEALNQQSALHKALASSQHWYRCAQMLEHELNKREDQTNMVKLLRALLAGSILLGSLGWVLFFRS